MAGARITFRSAIRPQQDKSSRYPLVDGSASGIDRGKPQSILRTGGAARKHGCNWTLRHKPRPAPRIGL